LPTHPDRSSNGAEDPIPHLAADRLAGVRCVPKTEAELAARFLGRGCHRDGEGVRGRRHLEGRPTKKLGQFGNSLDKIRKASREAIGLKKAAVRWRAAIQRKATILKKGSRPGGGRGARLDDVGTA